MLGFMLDRMAYQLGERLDTLFYVFIPGLIAILMIFDASDRFLTGLFSRMLGSRKDTSASSGDSLQTAESLTKLAAAVGGKHSAEVEEEAERLNPGVYAHNQEAVPGTAAHADPDRMAR